jgi:NAD(P)-dependent dehydrogenase (short-subunit alcohol dehydrogenase family)
MHSGADALEGGTMSELARLRGGVAVVTGAGGGIGEGVARAAADAGMRVVLSDINGDRVAELAAELTGAGVEAMGIRTDVADAASVDALAQAVHARFGPATLLVNNAGIETLGHIWDISAETWRRTIDIKILGVVNGVRAFMPSMLKAGAPGWVANLSSVGGLGMMPMQTPYILTKHAVLSFTECLALEVELTGKPISVSAVLPGPVATRIFDDAPAGSDEAGVASHRAHMQAMLRDHGTSSHEAGRQILLGIAQGNFWVTTHPEMMAAAASGRARHLDTMARPALTEDARRILAQ